MAIAGETDVDALGPAIPLEAQPRSSCPTWFADSVQHSMLH
jgi:hypothetical protein